MGIFRAVTLPSAVRLPKSALLLLLLLYWAVSLHHLTIVPPVYEDEPWQASTGYKLATEGVFGSDLFAGFYHMDRRYYGYLPLHPLFLALSFRLFGLGLFQARLETVTLGLLTLALTASLGRRLFQSDAVGILSILFLLSARLNGLTRVQPTGVLLLDIPRLARYDMVVPVFGLAALHTSLSAHRRRSDSRFLLTGLLAGLAGLGHLYGVFWLPALVILAIWNARGSLPVRPLLLIVVGFTLAWLPYLVYVATDLPDFRGQGRIYSQEGRFSLLSPGWYLANLLAEPRRYGPGLEGGWHSVLRPGFWSALAGLPLALIALLHRAVWRGDRAARLLVVPAVVIATLFALLIHSKLANYLVTLAPLGAVAAAWGAVALWHWLGRVAARRWGRLALVAVLLAVFIEGAARIVALELAARHTTPYADYVADVHRFIPSGARVLGLHNYWFGLNDTDYRAIWVPLRWTDPKLVPQPLPFDAALERVTPEFVLLDPRLQAYFEEIAAPEAPGHELLTGFEGWMARHDACLVGRVEDATYGTMEIYRLRVRDSRPRGGWCRHGQNW
ncbi:MAG: glycosyltransferase family 39 protein [Ardenticatenaceae bacterium]|nr:glycosyltransferase family 39 protein [Ardenticatenaceae bacterium]